MAFQTLRLKQIKTSDANPRSIFNDESIAELAQSIKADGLLQNLVVLKPKGKKKTYQIISGERRYRALSLLQEQGDLAQDYEVPVDVRSDLKPDEILRLATVENLQREDMHPMDEAIAIALLVQNGSGVDDISALTGLSPALIKRRMILTDLCNDAQNALHKDEITISQGEALTLGTHEQQKALLADDMGNWDAESIKSHLTDEKVSIACAIFPMKEYKGTLTHDLFATEDSTFFDDREQFMELQEKAVIALQAEKQAEGFEPVEIKTDYYVSLYQYRDAEEGEKGGVVIHYHPNGSVEIHEGLINRKLDKKVTDDLAGGQEKAKKPFYSKPVMEYIAMHKSMAVQASLLSNPRKAKEVAVIQMLRVRGSRVSLEEHRCIDYFGENQSLPSSLTIVQEQEQKVLDLLNEENFNFYWKDELEVYETVKLLSDEELDMIHLFMTTICFGQYETHKLDTRENSLFNLVAKDLDVDMRKAWHPDEEFLKKRNKEQLAEIVETTQSTALFGSVANWKKGDLVQKLAEHFKRLFDNGTQTPEEDTARNWLPEAMSFPAIDLDAKEVSVSLDEEIPFEGHGEYEDDEDTDYAEAA